MISAIIGNIVGSRFEFQNKRSKEFEFFHNQCTFTDGCVLTLAVGQALLSCNGNYTNLSETAMKSMEFISKQYPNWKFGGLFCKWDYFDIPKPNQSIEIGTAMHVSSCGIVGRTLGEVKKLAREVTQITHIHSVGYKASEAIAVCVFLARQGKTKEDILQYVIQNYYPIDFTLEEVHTSHSYDIESQGTMPLALAAFFESTDYEDAIRNAISIGGDSDTIAAITGAIAGSYYGIKQSVYDQASVYLDSLLKTILHQFERKYPTKIICNI